MSLLQVSGLSASYGGIRALRDVSLTVGEGEIVSVLGANGAGKSTLLKCLSREMKTGAGEIRFAGQPLPPKPYAVVQSGNIAQAADSEHQDKGSDSLRQQVQANIGDGRAGGEDAQLGAGILSGVKLTLEQEIDQAAANESAAHLGNNVAGNQGPVEFTNGRQGNGKSGVEARAGVSAEDECRNHNRKAPGNGDLDGAAALHAGLVQRDVRNNAIAEQDQHHRTEKFTDIR